MLHYPKIPGSGAECDGRCIAFEKYDGTNLHWDWDRDFGWHAFGTRRDQFDLTSAGIAEFVKQHGHLLQCTDVFTESLAGPLAKTIRAHPIHRDVQSLKAFAEFFGPSSFAGLHKREEAKQLRLFDIWTESAGFVGPRQFVADFGHLPIAGVVYEGRLTGRFTEDVRTGKFRVNEGVVCKGGAGSEAVWRMKIKTYDYRERLKRAFADRWEEHWE